MEVRLVHEETDCCCCGRTIPGSVPMIVIDESYTKPRVFCRRCYSSAPWRDGPPSNGSAGNGNRRLDER